MKILVIEDSARHREAAIRQLSAGHDLTVVSGYQEGRRLLGTEDYDVLLSDLLLPAEPGGSLGPSGYKHLGHEMPMGLVLALLAARRGVKKIAVITDANHHDHPVSSALDWISPAYWDGDGNTPFQVNGSSLLIGHAPFDETGAKDWARALSALVD